MFSPNGIQAILFDLDGTLRHNRPTSTQVFLDLAVSLGLSDSPEKRRQAIRWTHYYWAQSPEMLADVERFRGEQELFWTNYAVLHLIAFDCPPEEAARLAPLIHASMKNLEQAEDWVPPDVPETLRQLQAAGFRLAVLSNRTNPCGEYLGELGIKDFFDLALVAGELACWKPEPAIFHQALDRLGVAAGEAVYVGDNYYADVLGAERAGLWPVLIDPDGLFPEADCPSIGTIGELPQVLKSISLTAEKARAEG